MARSLSSAATLFAALSESAALMASRRGFSAAAAGSSAVKRAVSIEEKAVLRNKNTEAENSWVPDPVTGYYRPGNKSVEVDAAELRELLLSRRSQH